MQYTVYYNESLIASRIALAVVRVCTEVDKVDRRRHDVSEESVVNHSSRQ